MQQGCLRLAVTPASHIITHPSPCSPLQAELSAAEASARHLALLPYRAPPPRKGIIGNSKYARRLRREVLAAAKDPARWVVERVGGCVGGVAASGWGALSWVARPAWVGRRCSPQRQTWHVNEFDALQLPLPHATPAGPRCWSAGSTGRRRARWRRWCTSAPAAPAPTRWCRQVVARPLHMPIFRPALPFSQPRWAWPRLWAALALGAPERALQNPWGQSLPVTPARSPAHLKMPLAGGL